MLHLKKMRMVLISLVPESKKHIRGTCLSVCGGLGQACKGLPAVVTSNECNVTNKEVAIDFRYLDDSIVRKKKLYKYSQLGNSVG